MLFTRVITQTFWVQDTSIVWVVTISQFTFPDVRVKGSSTECPQRWALGWGSLCLARKRIISGIQNQGHHIYKALWVLWTLFKALCKTITYIFSLTPWKGQKPSSSGCVSGKGSWQAHSSHDSFPAPPNTTHVAMVNYRGAGEVSKLTQWKVVKVVGVGEKKGEEGSVWEGMEATMTLNKNDS